MSSCEKCWWDAYFQSMENGKSRYDNYMALLEERKDNPCTPEQKAGAWWNEEKQCDSRNIKLNF